jgi:hypothetical protein
VFCKGFDGRDMQVIATLDNGELVNDGQEPAHAGDRAGLDTQAGIEGWLIPPPNFRTTFRKEG